MSEVYELLDRLRRQGVELRVVNGGIAVKGERIADEDRAALRANRERLVMALTKPPLSLSEEALAEIRRLAESIGRPVEVDGSVGLLIGLFRDRAVVDTGSVLMTLSHRDVVAK